MIALASQKRWKIKHLYVKLHFFGDFQEYFFMLHPKGFTQLGEEHVYLFLKAIYGLK
jgi:hypothetical protein